MTKQVFPFKEASSYKARLETILEFCYKVCSLTQKAAADVRAHQHGRRSHDVILTTKPTLKESITQGFEGRCHHPSPPQPSHQ